MAKRHKPKRVFRRNAANDRKNVKRIKQNEEVLKSVHEYNVQYFTNET